ncbi:MAG: precorrin-3B C(17)-methyltransferase, partial [Paracoccaceae bacterium]
MTAKPVVFWFTASAEGTARRIAQAIGGEATGPDGAPVTETLRSFFAARRPLVGVCAAGVLIRALAPMLGDKWSEPPVVAVSEDGTAIVPLLGGHHGANDLARTIGEALSATPAITTAGDVAYGVALDSPPVGWVLENPADA